MEELYAELCLTSVCASVLQAMHLPLPAQIAPPNPLLAALQAKKLGDRPADRVLLYNPDAVALWLYQKYTAAFAPAALCSDLALPLRSVMPTVTPVCFASMYTGVLPEIHGIRKYTKPVLQTKTLFDYLPACGKRCAIVSTEGDSISKIFLEREIDYYIYDSVEAVNEKALALLAADEYDLITIYNGDYDSAMHRHGPEGAESLAALDRNVAFYAQLVSAVLRHWRGHNVLYGFCPDHGCHEIDGGCGSHGLDMTEDMNVIHFYGMQAAE
ncbi:MAG: alkaline phosphatase family protein [Clostridia bacterium]|nr:alkaline phosphatase family protein [Clostridia bacterium]